MTVNERMDVGRVLGKKGEDCGMAGGGYGYVGGQEIAWAMLRARPTSWR